MSTPTEKARRAILTFCRETKLAAGSKLLSFQVQQVVLRLDPPERAALNQTIKQMVDEGLFVPVRGELGVDLELTKSGSAVVYSEQ